MNINFVKFIPFYFGLSLSVIAVCVFGLVVYGLKPGLDFTGGSLLEYQITTTYNSKPSLEQIQKLVDPITSTHVIQYSQENILIRTTPLSASQSAQIHANLQTAFATVNETRSETVGPTLGKELLQKTLVAVVLASLVITFYVAFQFKSIKYGVSAIIAMLHDTLIVIGSFALLGHWYSIEVDTLFVTAVLTIMSFSVHDTIVVYDRIRESSRLHPKASYKAIVNKAIAETLGRSVNNSMTIIFMLSALVLLGGDTIRPFATALLIGTITGTYSSTFTAAPIVVLWDDLTKKISKK